MKNKLTVLLILILGFANAQRVGYVDTDYVFKYLPEYTSINKQMKTVVENWNIVIQDKQAKFDKLEAEFESEKVLLTPKQLAEKKKILDAKRQKLNELKQQKFGVRGEMVGLRQKMAQPLQDKIWTAIQKVSKKKKIAIVFDKSSDLVMLYTDPKYDLSDAVIEEITGKNPSKKENSKNSKNKSSRNKKSSASKNKKTPNSRSTRKKP